MRWRGFAFKRPEGACGGHGGRGLAPAALCLLMLCVAATAQAQDSVPDGQLRDSVTNLRYVQRMEKRMERWNKLIPTVFPLQYAGGTGMFSAGCGWAYGRDHKFETHLMAGFIPKKYNRHFYWTLSLREVYMPWRVRLGAGPFELRPLTVSLGVSSIIHNDFWTKQPERYPSGYYYFLSTRVRFLLGLGQRISFNVPEEKRFMSRKLSFYYEVSICDLYLRQKFMHGEIPLKDLLTIGMGLIYTI